MSAFEEENYDKQFDLGLWKRLFRYAAPYKKYLIRLIFIMMGTGGIDCIFPLLNRYAIDRFVTPKTTKNLWLFAIVYGMLVLIQAFNTKLLIRNAGSIENGICYDIRKIGFKRLQELSFSYYDKTPVGWILARLTSDTSRLGETISWGLNDLVWGFTVMIGILIIMFSMNWKLALISLSVVPLLVVASRYFQKKILTSYRQVRKTNSKITGAFSEGIMGAKTTKTLVREERNLQEFDEITASMYSSSVRAAIFSSIFFPVVMTLGSIGTALALCFGGWNYLSGGLSLGTLVVFISYTGQFFDPVLQIARIFAEFQSAQASAERVLSLIETEPDINDTENVVKVYGDNFHPNKENWPEINGNISFKNVSFEYKNGEKVLTNFNLDVKSGETIALVGETGSGKSTIINLACRFYEPTSGEILIDGVDYRKRSQLWLQSNLGYVLQSPHLFSGTIKDNIKYAKLDATDEEVINAAKLVNADGFIRKLENGYDTDVGEGGNRLSSGEKQLISFARAIIAKPKIFVLDEATSSIDTETEQLIQHAISKVLENRTSFIVAHRLSTIRSADRILVIRNGKITEQGNHNQLLKLHGYYYRLYTNQFKEESEMSAMNS